MTRRFRRFALTVAVAAAVAAAVGPPALAAKKTRKEENAEKVANTRIGRPGGPRFTQTDYGPFLTASFASDPRYDFQNDTGALLGDSTARGIAIRLSDD